MTGTVMPQTAGGTSVPPLRDGGYSCAFHHLASQGSSVMWKWA